ncbi:hypothetical protein [Yunchengibacter salinarum]|uniref:hypothetical protein n=1 Tax=Yunchengibacter salinarum TaxID=3133399 RepID=UPI0035B5BF64
MILETRSILFSDDELIVALKPILEAKGMDAATIPHDVRAHLNDEGEVAIRYDMPNGQNPVVFNSREVGAAILNHCIEQGVPLPRGSKKELDIRGEHLALIVRLESGLQGSDIDPGEE